MKKFFRLGLPVIVLALGMVFAGCDNASTNVLSLAGSVSVTFNWNTSSTGGPTVTRDFAQGTPVTPPDDQPTLNGFQFYGWYEQSLYNDGLAKYDFTQKETRKDFTLYAWWLDEDGNIADWLIGEKPIHAEYEGFIWVEGGTFSMDRSEEYEPFRKVTLSNFYLGQYVVTQKEYMEVMGYNPSHGGWLYDDMPVGNINWFMAVEYCNMRSEQEGLTPAYTINGTAVTLNRGADGYRLPTEAEWEYAFRGGTKGHKPSYLYAGSDDIDEVGWYAGNSPGYDMSVVGKKKPNELGLYDMSGNIWEWCWDWAEEYSYDKYTELTNPIGPDSGSAHILRGGSCKTGADTATFYQRATVPSVGDSDKRMGFRIVRSSPNEDDS